VIDRVMTAQGASFARTKLLLLVAREGPLRSADVAAFFGHAPRTVTEAVDGLERDGLVRRDPDPEDRRAKRISLTDAGRTAVKSADTSRRAFVQDAFGVLSQAECRTIVGLINRVNARLAEMDGDQLS
jgi:DNA-binding MarR family transcriptional regulator